MIEMDAELAEAFAASTKVSRKFFILNIFNLFLNFLVHYGVGANMLKISSKRRRTKA